MGIADYSLALFARIETIFLLPYRASRCTLYYVKYGGCSMSRNVIIVVVLAVAVLATGGALLVAKHNSNKDSSSTSMNGMNMGTQKNSGNSNGGSTATATNSVTIQGFAFSPADVTVKKGTTVTWTNQDSATHTVTETDGMTGPDSGDLANGKSYSFTYDTVGTFKYHCAIHPSMTGTVTVTE